MNASFFVVTAKSENKLWKYGNTDKKMPNCLLLNQNSQTLYSSTKQPHLSAKVQSRCLSPFRHNVRMSDEADTREDLNRLSFFFRIGRDPRTSWCNVVPDYAARSEIREPLSPWRKQLIFLRTDHLGDCCLHLVLRSPSGARQKRCSQIGNRGNVIRNTNVPRFGRPSMFQLPFVVRMRIHV